MPSSSGEGKDWLRDRIVKAAPESILDVGAGCGTYSDLLRPHLPDAWFFAIEIFAPYVERYGLHTKYDLLHIGDVRFFNNLPLADVVILGDVLEHLRFDEAAEVWEKARGAARLGVFLSLPVVEYPQGESEGNVHEAHLHTWSHDLVMASLPGIVDYATYTKIGVYQAEPET